MATISEPSAQDYADTAANSPMADFGYMSARPGIAVAVAHDIGKETGVDTTQPHNLAAVMHSATYADKLNAVKNGTDDRLVKRVLNTTPNPLNPKASGDQQEMDVYSGQEQNALNTMRAKAVLAARESDAQKKLSELSDFDSEAYKSQRLKETNPTGDIDNKILDLRMQAMVAKSALRNQLRALSPALRDQALNARMAVFDDAISTLGEIRSARLSSATSKIQDEINAKNDQVHTAKANVDALDGMIKTLTDQGDSSDAIYKIRLERAKAQKVLDKAQGSGVPDQEATMVNYLLDDLTKRGYTPSASDIANAKRIAHDTVTKRKNAASETAAGIRGAKTSAQAGVFASMGNEDAIGSIQPLRLPGEQGVPVE